MAHRQHPQPGGVAPDTIFIAFVYESGLEAFVCTSVVVGAARAARICYDVGVDRNDVCQLHTGTVGFQHGCISRATPAWVNGAPELSQADDPRITSAT